jgi:hypothetical protein
VKVYLHSAKETQQPVFRYSVNPGKSGLIAEADLPHAWRDGDEPREFVLNFKFGCAEVDDALGLWLLKHQMVHDRAGTAPKLDLKKIIRGWL